MVTRRQTEVAMACFTAAFGLIAMIGAQEYGVGWTRSGPEPGTFPFWIGAFIVAASLGNLVLGLRGEAANDALITREQLGRIASFALPIVAFVVATLWIGLYVATALYLFGTMVLQNGYAWWRATLVALLFPLSVYLLIEKTFKVPLLKGPLEALLGL